MRFILAEAFGLIWILGFLTAYLATMRVVKRTHPPLHVTSLWFVRCLVAIASFFVWYVILVVHLIMRTR